MEAMEQLETKLKQLEAEIDAKRSKTTEAIKATIQDSTELRGGGRILREMDVKPNALATTLMENNPAMTREYAASMVNQILGMLDKKATTAVARPGQDQDEFGELEMDLDLESAQQQDDDEEDIEDYFADELTTPAPPNKAAKTGVAQSASASSMQVEPSGNVTAGCEL